MEALISVHDVMPDTLADVRAIVDRLDGYGLAPVTLLVVPGCAWNGRDLAQLRRWQRAGHELAGHGWSHRAAPARGFYPRLHAALLSRTSGEHLSLTADEIGALLRRNHGWFIEQGLGAPEVYVPPAWALGRIGRTALAEQPFAHIETLRGVYDVERGRFQRLPLAGFEADTAVRSAALRLWNARAGKRHASEDTPLRVAIHPADLRLRLGRDLERTLGRVHACHTYAAWRQRCLTPQAQPSRA